jgi:imidazole glycerol-phosphate synthase subunit HisF
MDHDGTKDGFALELTRTISEAVDVPVIASGGAGTPAHFADALDAGAADAALAASVFHFGELRISEVKDECRDRGLTMR